MRFEVDVSGNTVVDWDSFCREVCKVNYLECEEKIGGPGKRVQMDESKFGKRNIGYQFMFRARMYRSLIPVFKSVKDQRTAHSCVKHKLITKIS